MREWWGSDARKRVLPFAAFMAVLALRGLLPEGAGVAGLGVAWLYALQAGLAAALLIAWRRDYVELAQRPSLPQALLSVLVGLVVFGLWITLDARWMQLGTPTNAFGPVDAEGRLQWGLVVVRWLGAALVVPVMEELFWRSFLMRWLDRPGFLAVDPRAASWRAVLLSTAVFTLAHTQWLAAIAAGLAYALLYRRTGSLWTAVIAHAVTNGVLGAWVVWGGHWAYW